jgi:hypothetical protein
MMVRQTGGYNRKRNHRLSKVTKGWKRKLDDVVKTIWYILPIPFSGEAPLVQDLDKPLSTSNRKPLTGAFMELLALQESPITSVSYVA